MCLSLTSNVTLSDGAMMPMFGLGLSKAKEQVAENAVLCALDRGYRLLDDATFYGNEEFVGNALKKSHLPRTDYFIVTKLWNDDHGFERTKRALKESLKMLKLDYVDLYLIHSPKGGEVIDTWKALIELKKEGLTRSIGVSNFNTYHLEEIKKANLPLPAVNQIELHPWLQQREVVNYCKTNKITIMGYSPLARGTKMGTGKAPEVEKISSKLHKTNAQILIRWSIQSGFITIPGSLNANRIKENANIFDFELTPDDMTQLDALEEGVSVAWRVINTPWEG